MTKKKNGDKDITPIGAHILEILARMPMSFKLIVGDVDEEKGQKLVNNALIGAAHHDFHKII